MLRSLGIPCGGSKGCVSCVFRELKEDWTGSRGHAAHLGDGELIFWCLAQKQRWLGQEGPSEVRRWGVGGVASPYGAEPRTKMCHTDGVVREVSQRRWGAPWILKDG